MKIIKIPLLCLVFIFVFTLLFLFQAPTKVHAGLISGCYTFGDVNNDSNITQTDADWILEYAAGLRSFNNIQRVRGDLNEDDKVNSADANYLGQYLDNGTLPPVCAGKTNPTPICRPSGDAFNNGSNFKKVTAFDLLVVLEHEAGAPYPQLSGTRLENGDVDDHGSPSHPPNASNITSKDGTLIKQFYNGLISTFGPCPYLRVTSSGVLGVPISGSQAGTSGTTTYGPTPADYRFDLNTDLTAPLNHNGYNFQSWSGCDSVSSNVCTVLVINDQIPGTSKTVTANYVVAPAGQPDYVPRDLIGPATVCVNEDATFTFKTYNQGNGSATTDSTTVVSTAPYTGDTDPDFQTYTVGPLAAGASASHSFTTTWNTAASSRPLTVVVDYTPGTIDESDETNNQLTTTFNVVNCVDEQPDYVIQNLSGPTSVCINQPYTYTANTVNVGNGAASNSSTTVVISDFSSTPPEYFPVGPLGIGASVGHSRSVLWESAGTYSIVFGADTYKEVAESNEGNNNASITVTVGNCLPDLNDLQPRVYHRFGPWAGQTVSSSRPADPNEQLQGQLRYYETTGAPAFQFSAHWWSNTGAIAEGSCDTSGSRVSGLWTNGTNTMTYDVYFDAPGSAGTYEFWEYLDADCNIAETDEGNNAEGVAYQVAAPPSCDPNAIGSNSLIGCLYDGTNFNTIDGDAPSGGTLSAPVADTATALDANWGGGEASPQVGSDTFSARWRGTFTFKAGTYTFYAGADDGIAFSVDPGALNLNTHNSGNCVESWILTGYFERSCTRTFSSQAQHTLALEFFEEGGDARASLRWTYSPPLPDLNDLAPRVYHTVGTFANQTVSSTRPAETNEPLRGEVRYYETTGAPAFQFNARHWSNIGSVSEGSCNSSGALASGLWTNGVNTMTYDVNFNAPGSAGTYNFFEYLDADGSTPICTITEGDEINNVEGVAYEVVAAVALNLDVTRFDLYKADCATPLGSPLVGDNMCFDAEVTNTGGDINTPFTVAFWNHRASLPVCNDGGFNASTSVASLSAGATFTWDNVSTAGPLTSGTKLARLFADQGCAIAESDEADNIETRAYSVDTNNWLQAIGGDVGAVGSIDMSNPGDSQTNYLLIGRDIGDAFSDRWQVNNYNQPLVPTGGVYNYFNNRFKEKAKDNTIADCTIPGSIPNGLSYCGEGNLQIASASVLPPNGSAVVFVDGSLIITGNIDLVSRSVVFVVRDSIIVYGATNSIDGVYIAGGSFNDCFLTSCNNLSPLTVNGAIYANSFFQTFNRKITPSGGLSLIVNYQPRYLVDMNDLLGSPSIVWREVAP